ncbi:MAG: MotA/TolQ/ExbB proton channel family protein [Luteolibacter sp.]
MDYLAISATQATLEFLQKGGIFIYPLILCSIVGLTAIAFKIMSLARSRTIPAALAHDMEQIAVRDPQPTFSRLKNGDNTLARLGSVAVRNGGKTQAEISQSVEAAAREEIVKMHSGIGVLDVVITIAPLLGLLGTASGLVVIFQGIGETTDFLVIAKGIAQALNTTIFGLAIAVPSVIAHSYFTRRIEQITARMETVMTSFISDISKLPTTEN